MKNMDLKIMEKFIILIKLHNKIYRNF